MIWLSGLTILLFAFCAFEFRAIRKAQQQTTELPVRLAAVIDTLEGAGKKAQSAGGGTEKSLEALNLDLQNFMRDMRSRQTGFERRLTDLDDRINHERETILGDLKSFLEDMRNEKQEFAKELDRMQGELFSQEIPSAKRLEEILVRLEERLRGLEGRIEEDTKRREEIYQEESGAMKIEGAVTGPGEDTRKRYP